MIDPEGPNVFAVPIGVDFAPALVAGIIDRYAENPPQVLAHLTLVLNTRRMARRVTEMFCEQGALLLPKICVLSDLPNLWGPPDMKGSASPLSRKLMLVELINRLLDKEPDLAPRSAAFDLAESLAKLLDEMQGEGVSPDVLHQLDLSEHAAHWDRQNRFLSIIANYAQTTGFKDEEARQRHTVEYLIDHWAGTPPKNPIILAGSTGSRGSTNLLMQAVAKLPNGTVVMPGLDYDMPAHVWRAFDHASEDHPQYRHYHFLNALKIEPDNVQKWTQNAPINAARNALISLAMRPAPVTDQWLDDAPELQDLDLATENVTWLVAPTQRQETMAIAMRLRLAAEHGQTAALITPDRILSRQITAQLLRWNIIPDDSAGVSLQLTSAGQIMQMICQLLFTPITSELLIALLKHPLTHSYKDRGQHLLFTRELELYLRKKAEFFPSTDLLKHWVDTRTNLNVSAWANWICEFSMGLLCPAEVSLAQLNNLLFSALNKAYSGPSENIHDFTGSDHGVAIAPILQELDQNKDHNMYLSARDFSDLIHQMLTDQEPKREDVRSHPNIRIWGTLEARVQGADLVILAGLNEGTWPKLPGTDPWLNRNLRVQAGLLLPERQIGLAAHDFQQAAAAPEIWLSRSKRDGSGETVMSRWLSRLQNLLAGLKPYIGADHSIDMFKRGDIWLAKVAELEKPKPIASYKRPALCPDVSLRPKQLSVTEIERLIRDPYAIYAKHILGLRPLDPLMRSPDALVRGITLHSLLEKFIAETINSPELLTSSALKDAAHKYIMDTVPWPTQRSVWTSLIANSADQFIQDEIARQAIATPTLFEPKGKIEIAELNFTLTAKADRIDVDPSGALYIYDYKTGSAPKAKEQTHFDKQLLLEALIAEKSGFGEFSASPVAGAVYISLNGTKSETNAPLDAEPVEKILAELIQLIRAYTEPKQAYLSRRAVHKTFSKADYDHLARFGEWTEADEAVHIKVGS